MKKRYNAIVYLNVKKYYSLMDGLICLNVKNYEYNIFFMESLKSSMICRPHIDRIKKCEKNINEMKHILFDNIKIRNYDMTTKKFINIHDSFKHVILDEQSNIGDLKKILSQYPELTIRCWKQYFLLSYEDNDDCVLINYFELNEIKSKQIIEMITKVFFPQMMQNYKRFVGDDFNGNISYLNLSLLVYDMEHYKLSYNLDIDEFPQSVVCIFDNKQYKKSNGNEIVYNMYFLDIVLRMRRIIIDKVKLNRSYLIKFMIKYVSLECWQEDIQSYFHELLTEEMKKNVLKYVILVGAINKNNFKNLFVCFKNNVQILIDLLFLTIKTDNYEMTKYLLENKDVIIDDLSYEIINKIFDNYDRPNHYKLLSQYSIADKYEFNVNDC